MTTCTYKKYKHFRILGRIVSIGLAIAHKKTPIWWDNIVSSTRQREDKILSISRRYIRSDRAYIYSFVFFMLNFKFALTKVK